MKKILIIAAFVYLYIAPLTYHPDNKEVLFWASQSNGAVWNIWEYGEKNLPPDKQYGYPPFHFILDKLQYAVAKPLAGSGFDSWIGTPHKTDLFQPNLARYMLASKFSLIIFSLIAGYFVYLLAIKLGLSEIRARVAAAIWFFNPISLYSVPIMGQNDVLAIAFFLGGWLLLEKRPWLSSLVFGLASSIKTYPLIWLIFLLSTIKSLSISKRVGVFCLSALIFGLTLVPFLNNPTFLSVGMKPEVNSRFLIPRIDIGFDQTIYVIPILLSIVFLAGSASAPAVLLTVNLILLGFSHFHPQWYTWTVPFFALWIVSLTKKSHISSSLLLAVMTVIAWIGAVLLFADKWLSIGLFGVTNPSIGNLPVIRDFLFERGINVTMFDSLAHTGLAAAAVIALICLFRKYESSSKQFQYEFTWLKKLETLNKYLKFGVAVLMMAIVMFFWVALTRSLPTPHTEGTPYGGDFTLVGSKVTGKVLTSRDNFYRYDLTFANPERANAGKYEVSLEENGKVLHQQIVSGLNMGEESTIRFDLTTTQTSSAGHVYLVSLRALEGTISAAKREQSPTPVYVKTKEASDTSQLMATTYFLPSNTLVNILAETINQIKEIVRQAPWYYLGLAILLMFAV